MTLTMPLPALLEQKGEPQNAKLNHKPNHNSRARCSIILSALLFLMLSSGTVFGDSLGITRDQLQAKYGKPYLVMPMSKEAGRTMSDHLYTVFGRGIYSVVDGVVVGIKYNEENEDGLSDADFQRFVARWDVGSGWEVTKNSDSGGDIIRELKRPDGSTGVVIRRKTSMMAIFRLGSWLKIKEDYDQQPWYKKIF